MPDALPQLLFSQVPEADVDHAFFVDPYPRNPLECVATRGHTPNGTFLSDLTPAGVEVESGGRSLASPAGTTEASAANTAEPSAVTCHQGRKDHSFISIRIAVTDVDTPTRRSARERRPCIHLPPVGEHVLQKRSQGCTVGPTPSSDTIRAAPRPGAIDLEWVLPAEKDARARLVAWSDPVSAS